MNGGISIAEQSQEVEASVERLWDYRIGGLTVEAMPESRLKELLSTGQIGWGTPVWSAGMGKWQKISNIRTLLPGFSQELHPWIRFFARLLDLYICSLCLAFVIGMAWIFFPFVEIIFPIYTSNDPIIIIVYVMLITCTWALCEPFSMAAFGTTPAKWLFNMWVSRSTGDNLTLRESFSRSIKVLVKGMALGIPILNLAAAIFSYLEFGIYGKSPWDYEGGFIVSHGKIGPIRILVIIGLVGTYVLAPLYAYL